MKKINFLFLIVSLFTFSSCKNEIKEDLENHINEITKKLKIPVVFQTK